MLIATCSDSNNMKVSIFFASAKVAVNGIELCLPEILLFLEWPKHPTATKRGNRQAQEVRLAYGRPPTAPALPSLLLPAANPSSICSMKE